MDRENIQGSFDNHPEEELENLKARIRMIFQNHHHQTKVVNQIYRLFVPEWERLKYIQGYPHSGEDLWKYICELFLEFDHQHHPQSQAGGIWVSRGFIMNTTLGPWEVSLEHCSLNYHLKKETYGRHSKS